jgi:hypothetical protein
MAKVTISGRRITAVVTATRRIGIQGSSTTLAVRPVVELLDVRERLAEPGVLRRQGVVLTRRRGWDQRWTVVLTARKSRS